MQSDKKTIFITGAASGIGRATACHFTERGWFVGLFDINEAGLREVAQEIGPGNGIWAHLDVTEREQWKTAVEAFGQATGGKMHLFFNNAGIGAGGFFEAVPEEVSRGIIDVNFGGVVNGIYACLPLLKATQGARIVNTSSVAGMIGSPNLAVYSATKHAVRGLTEALNIEFERHDIQVSDLMPWFIDTAILDTPIHGGNKDGILAREAIAEQGCAIYSVEIAAQAVWAAAHGSGVHRPVGGRAKITKILAWHFPKLVRRISRSCFRKDLAQGGA